MARVNFKINKKAIIFSIASILIVFLFVATAELKSKKVEQETEIEVTRVRVKVLNSMIRDMENIYFDKMIYIAAKNSLIGLSKFYYDNDYDNDYLKSLNFALQDVIDDGILKINDNEYNLTYFNSISYINKKYTINGLRTNLSDIFDRLNFEIRELEVYILPGNITQIDPWTIQIKADITYHLADKDNIASWKGTTTRTVNIPVYGLYAFDMSNSHGLITSSWKEDNASLTEPSVLNKLNNRLYQLGNGICMDDYCQTS